MDKETFIASMENEGYTFEGKPDTSSMMSPDRDFDWEAIAKSNSFIRGSRFVIHATDKDIAGLKKDEFDKWYEEHSKGYHFYDDWKKKFKGSEFLIPVIEKELRIRESMLIGDFLTKLMMIKDVSCILEEVIAEYKKMEDKIIAEI